MRSQLGLTPLVLSLCLVTHLHTPSDWLEPEVGLPPALPPASALQTELRAVALGSLPGTALGRLVRGVLPLRPLCQHVARPSVPAPASPPGLPED